MVFISSLSRTSRFERERSKTNNLAGSRQISCLEKHFNVYNLAAFE